MMHVKVRTQEMAHATQGNNSSNGQNAYMALYIYICVCNCAYNEQNIFPFSAECSDKDGTSSGSCADGFGVCCTCKP